MIQEMLGVRRGIHKCAIAFMSVLSDVSLFNVESRLGGGIGIIGVLEVVRDIIQGCIYPPFE